MFQLVVKMTMLKYYTGKLKRMMNQFRYEFWASDLLGKEVEEELNRRSKLVLYSVGFVYMTVTCFYVTIVITPLVRGNMDLPLNSIYGFDTKSSPLYEILYVLQAFNQLVSVVHGVTGHDMVFIVMSSNVVAQFVLLKNMLKNIKKEQDMNRVIKKCILHHYITFLIPSWTSCFCANNSYLLYKSS